MKWTEDKVAEGNEKYYRELIEIGERKVSELEEEMSSTAVAETRVSLWSTIQSYEGNLQGHYANLAIALYIQGKLDESKEAARKAIPSWREQFLPRLEGVSQAIIHIDETDCPCLPEEELHKKFSIEVYERVFLLKCVACNSYHARSVLPDALSKIHSIREELKNNTQVTKSIPDSRGL